MKKNLSIPKVFALAVTLAIYVFTSGCKTVSSPGTTGSFAGVVMLADTSGIIANFSGTTVSIDSTSFSTTSNSNGQWMIGGVPEGQYNITASKPGFGTFHWYQQQLLDGTVYLQPIELARMNLFTPVLSIVVWSQGRLHFNALLPRTDSEPTLLVYCDLDSTTQPSDSHFATSQYSYTPDGSTFVGDFSYEVLREAGAQSGQVLYLSASTIGGTAFIDPMHNETRWSTTGPKSNVIKVTMP
jgi:hypothetical protein